MAAINNVVATLALGALQGPIVAFTTPFAFCLGRLRFPRLPAATIIYVPVVVVSIFTLNFGPPGHYKIVFVLSALAYDGICYLVGVGFGTPRRIPVWKLIVAVLFYPVGLLLGALLAIRWVAVELPILSRGWVGAGILLAFFGVVGILSTYLAHRVHYGDRTRNETAATG